MVGKAESPNQHPSQAKMIRHAVPVINNSNSGMGSSFVLDKIYTIVRNIFSPRRHGERRVFLFLDRIYPAGPRQRDLRHNNGGQVRFTTTPFMTGFLSEPEDLRAGGRFATTGIDCLDYYSPRRARRPNIVLKHDMNRIFILS